MHILFSWQLWPQFSLSYVILKGMSISVSDVDCSSFVQDPTCLKHSKRIIAPLPSYFRSNFFPLINIILFYFQSPTSASVYSIIFYAHSYSNIFPKMYMCLFSPLFITIFLVNPKQVPMIGLHVSKYSGQLINIILLTLLSI